MMKGRKALLSLLAAGSLAGAIGCEAVGGVDLNAALVQQTEVESMEGSLSLDWDITPHAAAMPNEKTAQLLAVLGTGSLEITEFKQENRQTASFEGLLTIDEGTIAFSAYIAEAQLTIDAEGLKEPYVIDLIPLLGDKLDIGSLVEGELLAETLLQEAGSEVIQAMAAFLISKTPNPANTSLTSKEVTLNGEEKTVQQVSMALSGEEIDGHMRALLQEIIADEEGLKALIGTLYDALKPSLEAMLAEKPNAMLQIAVSNKTFAVEFLYEQLTPVLAALSEAGVEGASQYTEDSGLELDVLLAGGETVGMDAALDLSPSSGSYNGVQRIAASMSSRWWNTNGVVSAESYEGTALPYQTDVKPRHRLDNIVEGSLLYDILKHELKVTTAAFDMYMGANASVPDGVSPYIKGAGTSMVPVRYVSEQLDAVVTWDANTQVITIEDKAEGVTISMQIGEKSATVNGVEQVLPETPELVFGSTFVPIAFITKALGGTASWSDGVVTITKEF